MLFTSTWVHPGFLEGSVLLTFLFFVLSYYVTLRSKFRVVISVTISSYKRCSVRLYLQLFVGWPMPYLRYTCMCLFAYSGVQHIVLCSCFVFLRLVCHVLSLSLDCQFFIAPSVFSNCIVWRSCSLWLCCQDISSLFNIDKQ